MKGIAAAVLVLACAASAPGSMVAETLDAAAGVGVGVTYPGASEVGSPDGRLRVDCRAGDGVRPHTLLLRGGDGGERSLHEFGRSVQVAWSPDSKWLLVTDHRESDTSTCLLIRVSDGTRFDALEAFERERDRHPWLDSHHVYVACAAWLPDGAIRVTAFGYGDAGGFHAQYRVRVESDALRVAPDAGVKAP